MQNTKKINKFLVIGASSLVVALGVNIMLANKENNQLTPDKVAVLTEEALQRCVTKTLSLEDFITQETSIMQRINEKRLVKLDEENLNEKINKNIRAYERILNEQTANANEVNEISNNLNQIIGNEQGKYISLKREDVKKNIAELKEMCKPLTMAEIAKPKTTPG